jgi:putative methionine-R-sulfoxide reductase with GAF domain
MPDAAILRRLREILSIPGDRVGKARRISAAIRETGGYRWVGIYDGSAGEIGVMAWSGASPSATRAAPRSETVIPIPGATGGRPEGQLRVESDLPDAFTGEDLRRLEECAALLGALWG